MWEGEDFSIKFAYDCVLNSTCDNNCVNLPFKQLWMAKAFPNVLTATWRTLLNRLPTRENLSRRGVLVNTLSCALCQDWADSSQHLFLECKYAHMVWSNCYRSIGILFVQHKDLRSHFESFFLDHVNSKQNLVWKGVWATIVWSIWEQRNRIVFK